MTTTTVGRRSPRIPVDVFAACGYFLPRLMFLNTQIAPQIHWGDITTALDGFPSENIDLSSSGFWNEWRQRWVVVAESYVNTATTSTTEAGRTGAWRSAAACYHWAEFMYFDDRNVKYSLRQLVRGCFERSLESAPSLIQTETARLADGTIVPIWIILPPAAPQASATPGSDIRYPCVLISNGLDSITEMEPLSLAETYLARGIAAVLYEGPGQGLDLGRTPLLVDIENVVSAVVERVRDHDAIDAERLGFVGISFGGHLALRVAQQLSDSFTCVVNFSGGPALAPFAGLPRRLKDDFRFAFMQPPDADLTRLLADAALDTGVIPQTQVLSVHGALDDIFPIADVVALNEIWAGRHESQIYESEAHVCLNKIAHASSRAADWVHSQLCAASTSTDREPR
ncbi:alpha/beta hydrolase family protein [Nocardia salmonicida]|uniref:alpha/beta hydrolase family protein n=1 Tax=Nocardia salmonicida TaxID=53431 RepID=UPI00343735C3